MRRRKREPLGVGSFHHSPLRNGLSPFVQTTPLRPLGPLSTGSPTAARRAETVFLTLPLTLSLLESASGSCRAIKRAPCQTRTDNKRHNQKRGEGATSTHQKTRTEPPSAGRHALRLELGFPVLSTAKTAAARLHLGTFLRIFRDSDHGYGSEKNRAAKILVPARPLYKKELCGSCMYLPALEESQSVASWLLHLWSQQPDFPLHNIFHAVGRSGLCCRAIAVVEVARRREPWPCLTNLPKPWS